jgi:putrescine transport system substrate-binding protein
LRNSPETGIKVVYDVFDSNEVLETKLLAGGRAMTSWCRPATFLANQIKAGVFQKLDKSKLPNLANM